MSTLTDATAVFTGRSIHPGDWIYIDGEYHRIDSVIDGSCLTIRRPRLERLRTHLASSLPLTLGFLAPWLYFPWRATRELQPMG
jgi:hypothetical protein